LKNQVKRGTLMRPVDGKDKTMSYYSATDTAAEQAGDQALYLNKISIMQLYLFLLKLMVAGAMVSAPIALVIWIVNYAARN